MLVKAISRHQIFLDAVAIYSKHAVHCNFQKPIKIWHFEANHTDFNVVDLQNVHSIGCVAIQTIHYLIPTLILITQMLPYFLLNISFD